jgi:selenide,water dikinase
MIASMTLLNRIGAELAKDAAVHAMTDVTGFGLLGHALEMARGSGLAPTVRAGDLAFLAEAERLVQQGFVTGASGRNWASYGGGGALPAGLPGWLRDLLTDPQTSGGLLIGCAPRHAEAILAAIIAAGHPHARIIGDAEAGAPALAVV